jgi:hypothetical protein
LPQILSKMPKEHVHGPNCNHSVAAPNTNPLAQFLSAIQKPHIHGPDCNHSGGHQHGHSHAESSHNFHNEHHHEEHHEHQHGPDCNHSHGHSHNTEDPMIAWERQVDNSMKFIIQNPEDALIQLKQGNELICAGISELVRLGPQPDNLKLPHEKFQLGFATYFSNLDLMPVLIKNAQDCHQAGKGINFVMYLETILDLLYTFYSPNPPENSFINQFVNAGGIEFISSGEDYPGSVVLQSKLVDVYELGNAIKSTLVSIDAFKRKCFNVSCEKREETMKQFNICSRCR